MPHLTGLCPLAVDSSRETMGTFKLQNGSLLLITEAPGGIYNSGQLKKIASLADNEAAIVKVTEDQRLALFVSEDNAEEIASELKNMGLGIRNYQDGIHQPTACIGELCPESQQDALGASMKVTEAIANLKTQTTLRIGINGCSKCCVPCHTLDISAVGDEQGYRLSLGGKNSQIPEMATFMAEGIPEQELPDFVEKIISLYKEHAEDEESLQDVMERIGPSRFAEIMHPYSQDAASDSADIFGQPEGNAELPGSSPSEAGEYDSDNNGLDTPTGNVAADSGTDNNENSSEISPDSGDSDPATHAAPDSASETDLDIDSGTLRGDSENFADEADHASETEAEPEKEHDLEANADHMESNKIEAGRDISSVDLPMESVGAMSQPGSASLESVSDATKPASVADSDINPASETDTGDLDLDLELGSDAGDLDLDEADSSDLDLDEADSSDLDLDEIESNDLDLDEADSSDLDLEEADSSDLDLDEADSSDLDLDTESNDLAADSSDLDIEADSSDLDLDLEVDSVDPDLKPQGEVKADKNPSSQNHENTDIEGDLPDTHPSQSAAERTDIDMSALDADTMAEAQMSQEPSVSLENGISSGQGGRIPGLSLEDNPSLKNSDIEEDDPDIDLQVPENISEFDEMDDIPETLSDIDYNETDNSPEEEDYLDSAHEDSEEDLEERLSQDIDHSRYIHEPDHNESERDAAIKHLEESSGAATPDKTPAPPSPASATVPPPPVPDIASGRSNNSRGDEPSESFASLEYSPSGEVMLSFTSGVSLKIKTTMLSDKKRRFQIGDQIIHMYIVDDEAHIEFEDGLTMSLPPFAA